MKWHWEMWIFDPNSTFNACKVNILGGFAQLTLKLVYVKARSCLHNIFQNYIRHPSYWPQMNETHINVPLNISQPSLHDFAYFLPQFEGPMLACILTKYGMLRMSQWHSIKISKTMNFALSSLWRSNQGSNHLSFALRQVKHICLTNIQHIENLLTKFIFRHSQVPDRLKTVLVALVLSSYISCNWDIHWQKFYEFDRVDWTHEPFPAFITRYICCLMPNGITSKMWHFQLLRHWVLY